MTRVLAVFAAAALLLSGCAGGAGEYPAATATALQQHVLAVSDAASDGDAETALTRLDELATSAKTALARGTLTEERGASILSAIELVRADLEAMLEEPNADDGEDEEAPAEEPADTGNSGSGGSGGTGNSGDNGNSGEGNNGNGNGNGNGGSDEETEAPVEEEPVEKEPTPEPTAPVEEPTAPPTTAPPATEPPTAKPTEAPPPNGEEADG